MNKSVVVWLLPLVMIAQTAFAQKDKPAYQLFSKSGKSIKYSKMLDELEKADIVLFGEQHNDPIAHWLQLELTKDLHRVHKQDFALGAEMFETDVQLILNEYLAGLVPEKNFEQESRPWTNYKTDYRSLVRYAKENKLSFIATNLPRRYAAAVAAGSMAVLENFSADAKKYMAPLPVKVDMELPGYKKMIEMFGSDVHGNAKNVVQAQAFKDATMAHFMLREVKAGKKMLHFNGAYHSDNHEGINWYLNQETPHSKILTITTVFQDDLKDLSDEHRNKADFILVVPANMTKTY